MPSSIVVFWDCPGNHPVPEYFMPHSGTVCNVQGCGGERKKKYITVPSLIAAANEVAAYLYERSEPENYDNVTRQMMDDMISSHHVERIVTDYLKEHAVHAN